MASIWLRVKRKLPVKYVLLLTIGFVAGLWILSRLPGPSSRITTDQAISVFPNRDFIQKDIKQILIWQPFLAKTIVNVEQTCMQTCDVKCTVTGSKDDVATSDAVNFHLSDLWPRKWDVGTRETIEFPAYRRRDQVWIVSNMEPPPHLWGDLTVFNGIFNWTSWYRSDATLPWLYGNYRRLSADESVKQTRALKSRDFYGEKTKGMMLRISNCADSGRRYKLIKEMSKYLDIDNYGLCYDKPCGDPKNQADASCDKVMKTYRFYLAFENDGCRDYVTEKYWWSLKREQIPIVNWRKVNKGVIIPHSYINIFDFKDIKTFSEYIKKVNANATLYNSYFKWRTQYEFTEECPSCAICRALHDDTRPAQTITRLDAWVEDDVCPKVTTWSLFMKNFDAFKFKMFGI